MKTRLLWATALSCVLLLTVPTRARSAEPVGAEGTRVYLVLFGGPQGYKMSDVNRGIDQDNEDLRGTGFEVQKLTGGTGYGAGVRVAPSRRYALQFDYNRFAASVQHEGQITGGTPVSESVSIPANALTLTAAVYRQWHGLHYGLGVGPGYYLCRGNIEASVGSSRIGFPVEGHGFGFHALALGDISLSRVLRIEGALGYRTAKTGTLKVHQTELTLDDGSTVKADWTGLMTRIGFSVPFDPGHYPGE